jgi:hypothetical protein
MKTIKRILPVGLKIKETPSRYRKKIKETPLKKTNVVHISKVE